MALAHFDRLTYRYPSGETVALQDINVRIESGLTLVTGTSGSGKSTLLRLTNGLVPHFHGGEIAGSARVFGHDVPRTPTRALARHVGFVFQDPELQFVYPTVEREVAFGLENVGTSRAAMVNRVDEALSRVGALHLRKREIATLSGGERQRVALAAALVLRPQLVALDEPASQLDGEGATLLRCACQQLVNEGCSIIVTEQRASVFSSLASAQLHLRGGRVADDREQLALARPRAQGRPAHSSDRAWELDAVTVALGGHPILARLSASASRGTVCAVTGPNGSGKTTLLRVLAGTLRPETGRVWRRPGSVAFLPQDPSRLLHRPTLRDEVQLTISRAGAGRSVDVWLERVGLSGFAERYPRDLSSGERQRAAIAAVLAGEPQLALLDEPTRGMDDVARANLIRLLREVADDGTAVVVATHDAEFADQVADAVVALDARTAASI